MSVSHYIEHSVTEDRGILIQVWWCCETGMDFTNCRLVVKGSAVCQGNYSYVTRYLLLEWGMAL